MRKNRIVLHLPYPHPILMNKNIVFLAALLVIPGLAIATSKVMQGQVGSAQVAQAASASSVRSSSQYSIWNDSRMSSVAYTSSSRNSSTAITSSSRTSSSAQQSVVDLSVILDSNLNRVGANGSVVFSAKVKNVGSLGTLAKLRVFKGDMTYVSNNAACAFSSTDSTFLDCQINVPANAYAMLTVTMNMPPNFTCAGSMMGRSVFASVISPDSYPDNDTSNIITLLPVCP